MSRRKGWGKMRSTFFKGGHRPTFTWLEGGRSDEGADGEAPSAPSSLLPPSRHSFFLFDICLTSESNHGDALDFRTLTCGTLSLRDVL